MLFRPLVRSLSSPQLFQHAMSRHDILFVYVGATSQLKVHTPEPDPDPQTHPKLETDPNQNQSHWAKTVIEENPEWNLNRVQSRPI